MAKDQQVPTPEWPVRGSLVLLQSFEALTQSLRESVTQRLFLMSTLQLRGLDILSARTLIYMISVGPYAWRGTCTCMCTCMCTCHILLIDANVSTPMQISELGGTLITHGLHQLVPIIRCLLLAADTIVQNCDSPTLLQAGRSNPVVARAECSCFNHGNAPAVLHWLATYLQQTSGSLPWPTTFRW